MVEVQLKEISHSVPLWDLVEQTTAVCPNFTIRSTIKYILILMICLEVMWNGGGLDARVVVDRYRNDDVVLGREVKADGSKYCDMTGDGKDDYIVSYSSPYSAQMWAVANHSINQWVSRDGDLTIFGNTHTWGTWTQYGMVFSTKLARRDVHFADFDGKFPMIFLRP
jgi:hypothetical protein